MGSLWARLGHMGWFSVHVAVKTALVTLLAQCQMTKKGYVLFAVHVACFVLSLITCRLFCAVTYCTPLTSLSYRKALSVSKPQRPEQSKKQCSGQFTFLGSLYRVLRWYEREPPVRFQNRSIFPAFLRCCHSLAFYLPNSHSTKYRIFMLLHVVYVKNNLSQICIFLLSLHLIGESAS